MPSYYSIHRLARSEPHPDLESGNSVPWERKYTALCGYVGYSSNYFLGVNRGVTCLHCKKKMQSNTGLHSDGAVVCANCGYSAFYPVCTKCGNPILRTCNQLTSCI